jgi:hypothetical protein
MYLGRRGLTYWSHQMFMFGYHDLCVCHLDHCCRSWFPSSSSQSKVGSNFHLGSRFLIPISPSARWTTAALWSVNAAGRKSVPVIRGAISRDTYSINAAGASVGIVCIYRVLLPCVFKLQSTCHLGEGPTSVEMSGCISWVKYTIEVACYNDFPVPGLW